MHLAKEEWDELEIPPELYARLEEVAGESGRSIEEVITQFLARGLQAYREGRLVIEKTPTGVQWYGRDAS